MQVQQAPGKKHKLEQEAADAPRVKRKTGDDAIYQADELIMCKFNDGQSYKAKILRIAQKKDVNGYEIHYQGWNKRYDEFISEEEAKTRFSKFSEESEKKAKEKLKEAKKMVPAPPTNRGSSEKVVPVQPQRKQRHSESAPSNNISFDALDNLLNEDLSYVLCEENENILKHKKVPAFPATATIEHILNDFLRSKSVSEGFKLDEVLGMQENILPLSSKPDEVFGCLVNLFDAVIRQSLVYEAEKARFDEYFSIKTEEDGLKRCSKVLGFTYLLRFISRLPNILPKISAIKKENLKYLTDGLADLCTYLSNTIDKYYGEDYFQTAGAK